MINADTIDLKYYTGVKKYVKEPTPISAIQMNEAFEAGGYEAIPGDFLIIEPTGERYPVEQAFFMNNYTIVEDNYDLLEEAWSLIATAHGGYASNWCTASNEWAMAATQWKADRRYHVNDIYFLGRRKLIEEGRCLLACAYDGKWKCAPKKWRKGAVKWRKKYFHNCAISTD